MTQSSSKRSAVILTALHVETRAVLRHLQGWKGIAVDGTAFFCETYQDWEIAVAEVGPGNIRAASISLRAAQHFRPDVAVFVGVAGGLKNVSLGDVVVATKVYGYESGKEDKTGFRPRPVVQITSHALEQAARAIRLRPDWRSRLDPNLGHVEPKIYVDPIAAGEKVIATKRGSTAQLLRKYYSDALAIEMEGLGFLDALVISDVQCVVVRGISDLLSGKSAADASGSQERAADAAAAATFELLSSLPLPDVIARQESITISKTFQPRRLDDAPLGRRYEFERLLKGWEAARSGQIRTFAIIGQSGYGKTFLISSVLAQTRNYNAYVIRIECRYGFERSDFYPIISWLKGLSNISDQDRLALKLDRLKALCPDTEIAPYLGNLLSIDTSTRYDPLPQDANELRRQMFRKLVQFVYDLLRDTPLQLIVEDSHWIDPSTRELLQRLVRTFEGTRGKGALFIASSQTDIESPWATGQATNWVPLAPFEKEDSEALVHLTAGRPLPPEAIYSIVQQGRGNPMFIVQITKTWMERGEARLPADFRDSVLARLGREPQDDNSTLSIAIACMQVRFTVDVLAEITSLDRSTVHRQLERFEEKEVVTSIRDQDHSSFMINEHFRHVLLEGVSEDRIEEIHARIAKALKSYSPEIADRQPGVLANHFSAAGLKSEAIPFWIEAGKAALRRGAHESVLAYVAKGFADTKSANGIGHPDQAFELWWLRCRALMATQGYASPDTLEASREAIRLFQLTKLGWEKEYPVLYLNWLCEATLGGHAKARVAAEMILDKAKLETQPRVPVFVGLKTLGVTKFFTGQFLDAERDLQEAVRLYEVDPATTGRARDYGYELGAGVYAYRCFNQWLLGNFEEATTTAADLLAVRTEDTYTQTVLFVWHGQYQASRRDWVSVRKCCQEAKEQSVNFPMLSGLVEMLLQGADGFIQGYSVENINGMRAGLESYQRTGARFRVTIFQTFLAEALASCRRYAESLLELDAVDLLIKTTGECVYEAETRRVRGEVYSAINDARAEALLVEAIEIAARQSARALELRAICSYMKCGGLRGREAYRKRLDELYALLALQENNSDILDAKAELAN